MSLSEGVRRGFQDEVRKAVIPSKINSCEIEILGASPHPCPRAKTFFGQTPSHACSCADLLPAFIWSYIICYPLALLSSTRSPFLLWNLQHTRSPVYDLFTQYTAGKDRQRWFESIPTSSSPARLEQGNRRTAPSWHPPTLHPARAPTH